MKNFNGLLSKTIFAVLFLVIILSSATGVAIAAMSADYVWKSDEAQTGDFDFTDTEYTFDLFGDGVILPSDSGAQTINVPDFGANSVVWSFEENNPQKIPVVFYAGTDDKKFYSSYPFAQNHPDSYIAVDGAYASCSSISDTPSELAAHIFAAAKINWIWPQTLYISDGANYTTDTSAAASSYSAYNGRLCTTPARYGDNHLNFLKAALPSGVYLVAEKINTSNYRIETQIAPSLLIKDGIITDSVQPIPCLIDDDITSSYDYMTINDGCLMLVLNDKFAEVENLVKMYPVKYQKIGVFARTENSLIFTPKSDGNHTLVKLMPDAAEKLAKISVTITATVSA